MMISATSGLSTFARPGASITGASLLVLVRKARGRRSVSSTATVMAGSREQPLLLRPPPPPPRDLLPLDLVSSLISRHHHRWTTATKVGGAVVGFPSVSGSSSIRTFSSAESKPSKKKKTNVDEKEAMGYLAQKRAAKNRRRELWQAKMERKERLKMRRRDENGIPLRRDDLRRKFRKFFIKKKVDEEYMARKARQAGLDWKIQVAVLLERLNVVLPDKEDWEVEYEELEAHLMQFGKMYPKELFDVDYDAPKATTDEELMALLPKGYVPAPRETEADKNGDVRTTNRKLKTSVYLTVKDDGQWMMPTVDLNSAEDETLLQAAQRAVPLKVGSNVEFWCPSNAPWSVQMSAFSEAEREATGMYGIKKFFMKIQYDEGDVSEDEMTVQDYAWLDRGEIADRMRQEHGEEVSTFYHYML